MSFAHHTGWRHRALRGARWPWLVACAVLAACASQPPVPDWQMNAHAATQKALNAYLTGQTRVETQEWERARQALASTGRADLLARTELLRCAAQSASLALTGPCAGFESLRPDAAAPELAYADFLQAQRLTAAQVAVLPPPQRAVAQRLAGTAGGGDAAAMLAAMDDPLSRLVGAAALFQAGQAGPGVVALAVDTASAQGWRRPLIAWLTLQAHQAQAAGDEDTAARARRRLAVVAP